jgi:hypothetical protein
MPDRADYLARTLISRLSSLEETLEELPETERSARRLELVGKVLAIEAGIVNGTTDRLVSGALPTVRPGERVRDRDQAALADFLRTRIGPLS